MIPLISSLDRDVEWTAEHRAMLADVPAERREQARAHNTVIAFAIEDVDGRPAGIQVKAFPLVIA